MIIDWNQGDVISGGGGCDYPAASNVLSGVVYGYGAYTGTLVLTCDYPVETDVRAGVVYANGVYTGTYNPGGGGGSGPFPTLSTKPLVSGWGEQVADDPTIRSPYEGGYKQTRARFTRLTRKYHVSYGDLSQADKDTLVSWENGVKVGSDMWDAVQLGLAGNYRLLAQIQYKYGVSEEVWTAEFDVEQV